VVQMAVGLRRQRLLQLRRMMRRQGQRRVLRRLGLRLRLRLWRWRRQLRAHRAGAAPLRVAQAARVAQSQAAAPLWRLSRAWVRKRGRRCGPRSSYLTRAPEAEARAHGTRHAVGADGVARGQVLAGAEAGRFERAVAPQATHCRLPEPSKSGAASAPSWRLSLRLAPPPPSGPLLSSSLESVSFAAAVSACRGRGQGAWARGQTRARVRRHREIGPCSEHSGVGQARASGRCTWRTLAGSAPRGRRNSGEPWAPC
jgi:hypothetical protein